MDLNKIIGDFLSFLFVSNFTALTTIAGGSVAWWVYHSQKRDKKVNAARVILSEIRNAERKIEEISNALSQGLSDFPSVLATNSWRGYSYLFASDFDQDELEEINEFYTLCELIEDAVKKDNNFFWLTTEHRAQVVQDKLVDLIEKCTNKKATNVDFKKLASLKVSILDTFSNDLYTYSPSKTKNQLTRYMGSIKRITTTTTGSKLKKIARVN